ncbi:glycosyltransferase family 2 protein [Flavisericum labens]|uniref:glycosyltransferase family 2 protein n=1 Tax=Flavisericum labens TaxID=3377112 RepID=UPI00387AA860
MDKKISIIIPTYNRGYLIGETLDSILAQTYSHWECIVIDDGSTDNTQTTVAEYLKKDDRFNLVSRPNRTLKGPSASRNYGIELSKGDYLLFFDDDDILHPLNLELCVLELAKPNVSFCRYEREKFYGNFEYDFDYSKYYTTFSIDAKDLEPILKNELFCITGSIVWNRECFETCKFVEYLTYAEEWEVYSRIISSGFKGISINKCLFYGRKHPNATTAVSYADNRKSKKSYNDAILLVVKNLHSKSLLRDSILRYFIQLSLGFNEFKLYKNIMKTIDLSFWNSLKWDIFYKTFPLRLRLYAIKKKFK